MKKNTTKKDEFENLTSQLNQKQQNKQSTWKPEQEKNPKKPKNKKEETTPTSLRLTVNNFGKLKEHAYLQDRRQNAITNDALTAYFAACQKWEGQGHEVVLSNLLKVLKNK